MQREQFRHVRKVEDLQKTWQRRRKNRHCSNEEDTAATMKAHRVHSGREQKALPVAARRHFPFRNTSRSTTDFAKVQVTPVAGLILETKKSTDFSGEIFLERNYCPRTSHIRRFFLEKRP